MNITLDQILAAKPTYIPQVVVDDDGGTVQSYQKFKIHVGVYTLYICEHHSVRVCSPRKGKFLWVFPKMDKTIYIDINTFESMFGISPKDLFIKYIDAGVKREFYKDIEALRVAQEMKKIYDF